MDEPPKTSDMVPVEPSQEEGAEIKKTSASNPANLPCSSPVQSKCAVSAIQKALLKSDFTIKRLDNLISSAHGQERVLATLGYCSQILHYSLSSPPFVALLFRLRRRRLLSPSKSQKSTSPRLLALASLISETRTALRLFGLIPLWTWGSSLLKDPPTDPILRTIAWAQVFSCVVYQALENVAFLTSKGVISRRLVERWGGLTQWYLWSTRGWLGHVLLELVRVAREYTLAERERAKAQDMDRERMRKTQVRAWKKSLVNNIAWLPLCVHWSLEKGAGVPDNLVGVISLTAVAWGVRDLWKATA